jgi:hypothetical protein
MRKEINRNGKWEESVRQANPQGRGTRWMEGAHDVDVLPRSLRCKSKKWQLSGRDDRTGEASG